MLLSLAQHAVLVTIAHQAPHRNSSAHQVTTVMEPQEHQLHVQRVPINRLGELALQQIVVTVQMVTTVHRAHLSQRNAQLDTGVTLQSVTSSPTS